MEFGCSTCESFICHLCENLKDNKDHGCSDLDGHNPKRITQKGFFVMLKELQLFKCVHPLCKENTTLCTVSEAIAH